MLDWMRARLAKGAADPVNGSDTISGGADGSPTIADAPTGPKAPSVSPATNVVLLADNTHVDTRSGRYRVTFRWPEHEEQAGAYLDVAHGAGLGAVRPDTAVKLGTGSPYEGPLCPRELEFLLKLGTRDRAFFGTNSVPPGWQVTVEPLDDGTPASSGA